MNYFILVAIFSFLLIGLTIASAIVYKATTLDLNQDDCNNQQKVKDKCGDCCAIWDVDTCFKGKMNGNKCVVKSRPWILALVIGAVLSLLLTIIFLIVALVKRKSHSSVSSSSSSQ
jgi:uncharacterized BrkB/YihY/UPF0761 family membrane protein